MKIKEGDYCYIKGEVEYNQDFTQQKGGFPQIIFYIKQIINHYKGIILYNLVAPGYGEVGNYGNGSIYISKKFIKQLKKVEGYLDD